MLDWNRDVRPVLEATYQAVIADSGGGITGSFDTSGQRVNEVIGRDPQDERTGAVLMELRRAGYVDGEWVMQSSLPIILRLEPKAYELVAGWPGKPGDDTFSRLLETLDQRIKEAESDEERTKLEKFRDGVIGVGRDVLTEVLAKIATGQVPGQQS